MATKKYINLNNLSTFLTVLRETFAEIGHKHSISDVTDYVVDTALSSTSVNPVQNKIIDAEFEAVSNAMGALENAIDSKSDSTHTHDDRYYTESEIDSKLSAKSDSTHNHDGDYLAKESPSATGSFSLNRKESTSIGTYSVAEGRNNTASGLASHAEGDGTTASAQAAHAEGSGTTASSWYAHAEGWDTTASARAAHAEGNTTVAKGQQSHAEGFYTVAASASQHVQGKHNIEDANDVYAHIVGNGSSDAKSNAHTLDWDGNAWYAGTIKVGGTSYEDAVEVVTKDHGHTVIIETNKNLEQKFWRGTQAEYDAIEVKDDATMYIVTDGDGGEGGGGVGSLEDLGITATADELNYMDGVTSNVQNQLDNKADSSHSHSASEITSGTLSSNRLPTVPMSKGGTGATDGATGLKNLFAAGQTVLSSNQYGSALPSTASEGTMFFKKATGTIADMDTNLVSELMLKAYPVGSIYMSVNSTSPASLFGGTWTRLSNTFLWGTDTDANIGKTGGESAHTLTVNEMPSHNHGSRTLTGTLANVMMDDGISIGSSGIVSIALARERSWQGASGASSYHVSINATHTHDNNGGGAAHNNMPPYLEVAMWKRTA